MSQPGEIVVGSRLLRLTPGGEFQPPIDSLNPTLHGCPHHFVTGSVTAERAGPPGLYIPGRDTTMGAAQVAM